MNNNLRITEIFYSIQGETNLSGLPTVFIRLTGCPLRCQYCDTAYAFKGGSVKDIDEIILQIKQYKAKYITVTGGEPLAQPNCLKLLDKLVHLGYVVSLETSGALDVSKVNSNVIKILDLKTPASLESNKNKFSNLDFLSEKDQIKFVICNREDYEWAKQQIAIYNLINICEILFSPSVDQLDANVLADWIIADQLLVRFQIQLHKVLWGNVSGK